MGGRSYSTNTRPKQLQSNNATSTTGPLTHAHHLNYQPNIVPKNNTELAYGKSFRVQISLYHEIEIT